MTNYLCDRCKVSLSKKELKDVYQCPICKAVYDKKTN